MTVGDKSIVQCGWTNLDDQLEDPGAKVETCPNPALWISCEPYIGVKTCDEHKCRCARPLRTEKKEKHPCPGGKKALASLSGHVWLPDGWRFFGVLPIMEPDLLAEEDGSVELGQDVCWLSRSDGRFIVDVGWHPEFDASGSYICRALTTDGLPKDTNPWDHPPMMTFETKKTADVWKWLSETVSTLASKP